MRVSPKWETKCLLPVLGAALGLVFALATGSGVSAEDSAQTGVPNAQARGEGMPTFTKDVAPILFDNCAICHRPGEVAPMSLLSYTDARPWSWAIKEKVVAREMPPWHADPTASLEFGNDRRLTEAQIDTIVAWVDAGAPKGNDADLPPLPQFAEGWLIQDLGEPDVVIEMPVEAQIQAEGEAAYERYYVPVPWTEAKYVQAIESKPGNRRVTHHTVVTLVPRLPAGTRLNERGVAVRDESIPVGTNQFALAQQSVKLTGYAPGKGYKHYPAGAGRLIPPGWYFSFSQHYQPTGKPETDRSLLGLWFHDSPVKMDVNERGASDGVLIVEGLELVAEPGQKRPVVPNIPPYAENWKIVNMKVFPEAVTIFSLSPHMHLRGKDATYVLVRPDGSQETLLTVPRYDFNWQTFYVLAEPLTIPAGSKIVTTGHFDNSLSNRYNPSPDKEVYWAEQSWDEMFVPFYEYGIDLESSANESTQNQRQE